MISASALKSINNPKNVKETFIDTNVDFQIEKIKDELSSFTKIVYYVMNGNIDPYSDNSDLEYIVTKIYKFYDKIVVVIPKNSMLAHALDGYILGHHKYLHEYYISELNKNIKEYGYKIIFDKQETFLLETI